ncbi:MAG: PLP-dependent aminotransferase family protein [Bacteroidota bacterium]
MLAEPSPFVFPLDRHSPSPLSRQIYQGLRDRMANGQLGPGARLPSTRALAVRLGVARGTVVAAYDQLQLEGYLVPTPGSGTSVASTLPEAAYPRQASPSARSMAGPARWRLPARSQAMEAASAPYDLPGPVRPLRPCLPPIDLFPVERWARTVASVARSLPVQALGYGDPQGYGPLREALAGYLGAARGIRCTPDQIVVTTGSQQALRLAFGALLDPGDQAWVESPGYGGVRTALADAGGIAIPVPVDARGLVVAEGTRRALAARVAVVAPAHQYPCGVTMSLGRRVELLAWAHEQGGWIVEDDYDGAYRYDGAPLSTLHSLDPDGRVIYVGTMSKVLAPALRVGYAVVPPGLVGPFVRAKAAADGGSPGLVQAALAQFITEGDLGRHVRRMRRAAWARRDVLVEALREGGLAVEAPPAGLHLYLPCVETEETVRRAEAAGVTVVAPVRDAPGALAPAGLAVGFAAFREGQIRWAARELARVAAP